MMRASDAIKKRLTLVESEMAKDNPLGTGVRIWLVPFALVAVITQASAALSHNSFDTAELAMSAVLLALTGATLALPWHRLPRVAQIIPPLVYLASVALLISAEGEASSGLVALVLVPILWIALFYRPWEAAIMVIATVAMVITVSVAGGEPTEVTVRRFVLWGSMAAAVSIVIQLLRAGLTGALTRSRELLRESQTLSAATEELTSQLDPAAVRLTAARLIAEITSPPGTFPRGGFLQVEDDVVRVAAQFDEAGMTVERTWPLEEHPLLLEAVKTGRATSGALVPDEVGPTFRQILVDTGITHGAWVPIESGGVLLGVLALGTRGVPVRAEQFQRCLTVGHIVGLALANASAHERLAQQSMTDYLTGLSNRLGLEAALRYRGRRPFTVLSLDLDGLKETNDTRGHHVGDELLVATADAVRRALRGGDVVARIGGDEFAAYLFDAGEGDGRVVAERALASLRELVIDGVSPQVSIGIATGGSTSDPKEVLRRADSAMYEAKQRGGMRYVVDRRLVPPEWPHATPAD